jgi:3-ketosteroid 9alpha-monooxygenase subunit B
MFHSLRVTKIVQETPDARSVVLEIPHSLARDFAYRAGQFVTVEVAHQGGHLRRCYSLASAPDCGEGHKFTVKKVHGGPVSTYLNDALREGDVLQVMRPEGRFVMDEGVAPLLLFAGGSGITPVISILKTALRTTSRRATLLYANRDERSIIFARELEQLRHQHGARVNVLHHLDEARGYLTESAVRSLVDAHAGATAFLCGPGPFMALVERVLLAAGWPEGRVRIERFEHAGSKGAAPAVAVAAAPANGAAAGGAPAIAEGVPASIEVHLRGQKHLVPYTPGKTLLQTARDAGIDAPYSCEEGFCGCCASHLLEGKVVMAADDALSSEEKKKGMILACQSKPTTTRCAFRFVD